MHLEEFYNYKNKLIEELLTDKNILKLIDEDTPLPESKNLVYKCVFPYEYIPKTVEEAHTFICVDVDILKTDSVKPFYLPAIYIWVFTHSSKLRLPEGGIRTDALVSAIAQKINGSRNYGLGETELYSVKRFAPMTGFTGKVMTFYTKDFSRVYDPKKPIPSNRKRG